MTKGQGKLDWLIWWRKIPPFSMLYSSVHTFHWKYVNVLFSLSSFNTPSTQPNQTALLLSSFFPSIHFYLGSICYSLSLFPETHPLTPENR